MVIRHLPKPGTICLERSIEGTSVGLATSEVVGNVGIGGFVFAAAIIVLLVLFRIVKVFDGIALFFPLNTKA